MFELRGSGTENDPGPHRQRRAALPRPCFKTSLEVTLRWAQEGGTCCLSLLGLPTAAPRALEKGPPSACALVHPCSGFFYELRKE